MWRTVAALPPLANVMFNQSQCGNMRYELGELQATGEWFQKDGADAPLQVRCEKNPAAHWGKIEAIGADFGIVLTGNQMSHVILEDLRIEKVGTHGIHILNGSTDIVVRRCDLRWIGGAIFFVNDSFSRLYGEQFVQRRVRYGNGIETWSSVSNVLIEGCRVSDVFDGGITLQGFKGDKVTGVAIRDNVIWNCGYDSIDIAHGLAPIDVFIEHNTCWNAGEGWALQGESRPRYSLHIPDQLGYHLNFEILDIPWDEQTSVTVRNNIFANAPAGRCFNFGPQPPTAADFQRFKINHNCYFQANSADTLVQFGSRRLEPKRFGFAQFAAYQQESSWDTNSIVANPQFINPEGGDFRLSPDSPATGMGVRSGAAISK
jgi:hypothetical protein